MLKFSSGPAITLCAVAALLGTSQGTRACTTILVGKAATEDGSVLMATSCDGDIMGRVYVMPARDYSSETKVPMFYDFPAPSTWKEHLEQRRKGYTLVGHLPIQRTYRCVLAAGHLADSVTGGINEHGLSMGIEYMGMRPELVNTKGRVSTCSNHWTTSLIANGLMRAKTAREAIRFMGSMVEKYGFTYYWAPSAGCAIPMVDGKEAWIMEIFGPGKEWTPGNGEPGAVWCAQRVPDGEVSCNANRSRIGEVVLENPEYFLASPNIYSLAEELDLWKPGRPFVWYEAYGTTGDRGNSLREWAALNRFAPSRRLAATGDPLSDRYPFSVKPDRQISVRALIAAMRDGYEGTDFDVTEHPEFSPGGKKSPLARPFGSRDLFDLVGIKPERCIGSETSGYVYVSQIRNWLPAPISGCMWFALGPSYTSCFAPIYSGVNGIAETWTRCPDFTRVDRTQVQWKFQLTEDLAGIKYQEAIKDIRAVFEPAEKQFLGLQPDFEAAAVQVFEKHGATQTERFVTQYTNSCLKNVDDAYEELVDFLMFKYLYSYSAAAPPKLPIVRAPRIPPL
jgi:dipeptidase